MENNGTILGNNSILGEILNRIILRQATWGTNGGVATYVLRMLSIHNKRPQRRVHSHYFLQLRGRRPAGKWPIDADSVSLSAAILWSTCLSPCVVHSVSVCTYAGPHPSLCCLPETAMCVCTSICCLRRYTYFCMHACMCEPFVIVHLLLPRMHGVCLLLLNTCVCMALYVLLSLCASY